MRFFASLPHGRSDDVDPVYAEESVPDSGEWAGCKQSFMSPLRISVRGSDVLYNPLFNKGTAFKSGERQVSLDGESI